METNALKHYHTSGEIIVEIDAQATVDPVALLAALSNADDKNPWIAHFKSDGKRAPSMIRLQISDVQEGVTGFLIRRLTFEPNFSLKQSQLTAYETYVQRLVIEMSGCGIAGVLGVGGRVILSKMVTMYALQKRD